MIKFFHITLKIFRGVNRFANHSIFPFFPQGLTLIIDLGSSTVKAGFARENGIPKSFVEFCFMFVNRHDTERFLAFSRISVLSKLFQAFSSKMLFQKHGTDFQTLCEFASDFKVLRNVFVFRVVPKNSSLFRAVLPVMMVQFFLSSLLAWPQVIFPCVIAVDKEDP